MGWFASISSSWLKVGLAHSHHKASAAPAADSPRPAQATRASHPARWQGVHPTPDTLPNTRLEGYASAAEACPAPAAPLLASSRNTPPLKMRSRHEKLTGGVHPKKAVRLVISGRMADVCAELERLAANEARLYNTVLH